MDRPVQMVLCALLSLLVATPAQALTVERRGPASWGIATTLKRALRELGDDDDLRLEVRTRSTRRRIRVLVRVIGPHNVRVRIQTSLSRQRRVRWRATRRLALRVATSVRAKMKAAREAAGDLPVTVASRDLDTRAEQRAIVVAPVATPRTEPLIHKAPTQPPSPRLPVLEVGVGVGYGSHSFSFESSRSAKLAARHSTGGFAELVTELSVFPLRAVDRSPLSGLGLRLTYARALGLETSFKDSAGKEQTLDTDASRGWGGFVFALPRFDNRYAPWLELRAGFSFVAFVLDSNTTAPPHVELFMGGGAALVQPFTSWLQLHVGGEYRAIIAAATLMDAYKVGVGSVQAGLVTGGVQGRLVAGLGYTVTVDYEPFSGEVPASEGDDTLRVSGHRLGCSFALRYAF